MGINYIGPTDAIMPLYKHVYNRGVEKRKIFMSVEDYFRFVKCLKEFNNKNKVVLRDSYIGPTDVARKIKKKSPIVDIICYCLMPNHFHLVLKEKIPGGISLFMKKLGDGYTGYFNLKYDRVGSLFQGGYKSKIIESDEILKYLIFYIHNNPIELTEPNWKEQGIKDATKLIKFINSYKWSSHYDYIKNLNNDVFDKNFFSLMFDNNIEGYKNEFLENLKFDKESILTNSYALVD